MYNNGNSSKNVTGASVVDGTLENADFADNGLSGDKIDGGIISNFQSTGIDDRLPTGKILTLSTTGADIDGSVTCDGLDVGGQNLIYDNYNGIGAIFRRNGTYGSVISLGRQGVDDGVTLDYPSSNTLGISTNGTEKVRILSSGGITFNGDTAAANALDDYEEGYWTAGLTANVGTITINAAKDQGSYTKVGRLVTVQGAFRVSAISTPSGDFRITGLPYTPTALNESAEGFSANVGVSATASNVTGLIHCISEGGTSILVREGFGTTANLATLANKIDTGTYIYVSATYYSE